MTRRGDSVAPTIVRDGCPASKRVPGLHLDGGSTPFGTGRRSQADRSCWPRDAIATCVIRLARAAPGIVKTVLAGKQPAPLTLKELTQPSPVARRYRGSRAKSRGGNDCAVPYPREPVLVRMAACPVQNSSPHLPRIALRSLLSGPPLPSRPFSSIHLSRMSLSALDRLERLPSPSSRNDSFPDAGARARRHL